FLYAPGAHAGVASVPTRRSSDLEELGLVSQVAVDVDGRTYAGMGVDFADYNNDGWPDIVVTDLANQRYSLYQNVGDGSFNYATSDRKSTRLNSSHGSISYAVFCL